MQQRRRASRDKARGTFCARGLGVVILTSAMYVARSDGQRRRISAYSFAVSLPSGGYCFCLSGRGKAKAPITSEEITRRSGSTRMDVASTRCRSGAYER